MRSSLSCLQAGLLKGDPGSPTLTAHTTTTALPSNVLRLPCTHTHTRNPPRFPLQIGGRYTILLMSIFSIFTGLIYNDVFSKSVNVFGSSWHTYQSDHFILNRKADMIDPANKEGWYGTPYPFGVDPIWQIAENKVKDIHN